jgi:hypothetical protein
MKHILIVFFCLSFFAINSQTKLDSLVFNKVNAFRQVKGLQKIDWNKEHWVLAHSNNVQLVDTNRFSTDNFVLSIPKSTKYDSCYVFLYKKTTGSDSIEDHAEQIFQHWISNDIASVLNTNLKKGSVSCSNLINVSFVNFVGGQ